MVILLGNNKRISDEEIKQKTPFTHEEFYRRYYVHRLSGFAVTIHENNVLMVQQYRKNDLVWGFPGGLIEKGEAVVKGTIREVREETGIIIEPVKVIGLTNWAGPSIFPEDPYKHHFGTALFFSAKKIGGEINPDKLEILQVKWIPLEELEKHKLSDFAKRLIFAAIEEKGFEKILEKIDSDEKYVYYFSA